LNGTQARRAGVRFSYPFQVAALAVLYMVTGKLGLLLSVPPGFATLIWPPSGLALGICLVHGRRLWPGIWLGSFLLNASVAGALGAPPALLPAKLAVAAAIGAGSTLQTLIACVLADRVVGAPLKLSSVAQILKLFLLAGPLACVTAASIGVASLRAAGLIGDAGIVDNWLSWWGGDVFGIIVFLPLALVAPGNPHPIALNGREIGRISALSLLLLLIPLGLTFYAWKIVSVNAFNVKQEAFQASALESERALGQRLESCDRALAAAAAFWRSRGGASVAEWRAYVDALNIGANYPGMRGLGMIEAAPDGHPAVAGPDHFVITRIEPLDINREALGLDLAFEANRKRAVEAARDLGVTTVTGKIVLVQDKEKTPGFLLIHPLFTAGPPPRTAAERKARLLAWVYAPFVAADLFNGLTETQGKDIDIRIFDGAVPSPDAKLYDSGVAASQGVLSLSRQLHIGQRTWRVVWTSTKAYDAASRSVTPVLILSAGLLFTAMLAMLFLGMGLRHRDAVDDPGAREKVVIPATVFLTLALGSAFLYRTLSVQEDRYLDGLMQRDATEVQELEQSRIDGNLRVLQRSVQMWSAARALPGQAWRGDAEALIHQLPGLRSLAWYDGGGAQVWALPEAEPPVRPAAVLFTQAALRNLPVASAVASAAEGDRFEVVVPVGADARVRTERTEALVASYDPAAFGAAALTNDIRSHYQVDLDAGGRDLNLNRGEPGVLAHETVARPLTIAGQEWRLDIRPTQAFLDSQRSAVPVLALVAGLVIALLSALSVQILLTLSRKSAELMRSEETFRLAMENAPIGMALVAPEGRWLSVNAALCKLLGYTAEDLLKTDFQAITHPEDLDADLALVGRVLAGETASYAMEKRYIHKDGHIIWGLLHVALVRDADGAPSYFISQIQDVTERREMERLKSDFISTVSHELRTPLTSIRGSLDFVAASERGGLSEAGRRLIDLALRNCDRLVMLVGDILDIDKIASGTMRFEVERADAGELLEQAVALNRAFADKWNVTIDVVPPAARASVAVDPERFHQAMTNLISNAVKFTPAGGRITVSAGIGDHGVRFAVADRGPGIPAAFRPRIFGRFAQADSSSTRSKGGSGLGLHITKELVEHMGGTIGYESVEGAGATFWISFPAVPA
jgi:PAS domain S-box-containing protein